MARPRALCLLTAVVLTASSLSAAARESAAPAPAAAPAAPAAPDAQGAAPAPSGPLAIHIGDSDLTIGGFMDMTSITRSTDTGNGLSTNFSSFPFTTTSGGAPNPAGNLSETRFSAQNSRLTLQATSKVGTASVKGYLESDFLGNTAQNLNVTSNSDGLRLRIYWVQYTSGKFEFLGGQSWSMLTPNRNGLSPVPGDIFYSQDVDTNYQMGLTWTRNPQFRFVYHASSTVTAGISIENPEQYTGSAVALPGAFTATEVDTGSGGSAIGSASATPNLYPDIIGKIALDPKFGGLHEHIDAAFLVSGFKTFNATGSTTSTKTGTGGSLNVVLDLTKTIHVVATNFFSNGGGRYIANTNMPDFVVNPDFSMSLVKTWSGIYGAEVNATPKSLIYAYYSVAQATANTGVDANGTTPIGYGIAGSQSANHKIQETSVGLVQTLFRDAKIGGMQVMVQFSDAKRTPFSVPANTPTDATVKMFYFNVRYLLP